MEITHEVERMKKVACPKGHGPAELPQEGNWTQVKEIRDISSLSHGIGWCAPQQGCCKLTLNVKNGVIQDRKSTRLNSSHKHRSRMPSSA